MVLTNEDRERLTESPAVTPPAVAAVASGVVAGVASASSVALALGITELAAGILPGTEPTGAGVLRR